MRTTFGLVLVVMVAGCGVAGPPAPEASRQVLALTGFNHSLAFDCTTDAPWVPRPGAPSPSPSATPSLRPPCGLVLNFTQGGWGSRPRGNNPGAFLKSIWAAMVPDGVLTVGVGHTLTFTSAESVGAFLPSGGSPGWLRESHANPDSPTDAGVFAGQLTALKLNVLASVLRTPAGEAPLADLEIASGPCAGDTVAEFLNKAERALGGDMSVLVCAQNISALSDTAAMINEYSHEGEAPDDVRLSCPTQ